jgi:type II secretory pathway component PulF
MLVAHFCRVMGTLLSTGIALTRGLEILMEFSENEFFRTSIIHPLYDGVREGQGVSQVMMELEFFPDMVSNMVAVGESTGEVPRMLLRISQFYDEEVIYTLDGLLAMIEPIMVAGMGLLVCFVLLSVFLPLYQVIMSMGS